MSALIGDVHISRSVFKQIEEIHQPNDTVRPTAKQITDMMLKNVVRAFIDAKVDEHKYFDPDLFRARKVPGEMNDYVIYPKYSGVADWMESRFTIPVRVVIEPSNRHNIIDRDNIDSMKSAQRLLFKFGLSARARNCLFMADVFALDELQNLTVQEFVNTPNVGHKTLQEIKQAMCRFDIPFSKERKYVPRRTSLPHKDINGLCPTCGNDVGHGTCSVSKIEGID
uniref:RNA polymerase alpha subunit C-terminal domain-containing protein n=1 Tax=viral metagenome TaxID=1070528 RepID=A0A2V0RB53_9ZZZZ